MEMITETVTGKSKGIKTAIAVFVFAAVAVAGMLIWYHYKMEAVQAEYDQQMKQAEVKYDNLLMNKQQIDVAEDAKAVSTELSKYMVAAQDLIVDKYTYAHADEYTKEGTAWLIFNVKDVERIYYEGEMGIGLDFNKIKYEIDPEQKKIEINLPELKILSHSINSDSFRADMIDDSMYVESNSEEYQRFENKAMLAEEEKVKDNPNVWNVAKNHTEETFRSFFRLSDMLDNYEVSFVWGTQFKGVPGKPSNIKDESSDSTPQVFSVTGTAVSETDTQA